MVLVATVGVEHRRCRRSQACPWLGNASWPDGILRCPSKLVFHGPGNSLGPRLCASGDRIYAVAVVATWAIRAPAQPAVSLRGLFFRRSRHRYLRNRERPARVRRVGGPALGHVARDCFRCLLPLYHPRGTNFRAQRGGSTWTSSTQRPRLRSSLSLH